MRDVPVLADRRGDLGPVRLGHGPDGRAESPDLARRDRLERRDESGVDHRLPTSGRNLDLGRVDEVIAPVLLLVILSRNGPTSL